jgi:hypothetical protein
MMSFWIWLESLTIRQFAILYLVICIAICAIVLAVDWWFATAEIRAIRRRDRAKDRLQAADVDLLKFPIERSRIDPAYRNGQFRVPYAQRDFKGVHKL